MWRFDSIDLSVGVAGVGGGLECLSTGVSCDRCFFGGSFSCGESFVALIALRLPDSTVVACSEFVGIHFDVLRRQRILPQQSVGPLPLRHWLPG